VNALAEWVAGAVSTPAASVEGAAAERLRVTVCRTWPELLAHRADWERLLASSPAASIFNTPEWLGAWWEAFGSGHRLACLLFFDAAGELVGLAPLYRDEIEGPRGLRLSRLRFVGDGSNDSDNLDFVWLPGREAACLAAFVSWLEEQLPADLCELNTLADGSETEKWLRRELKARAWAHEVTTRPRLVIALPESWEAYLAGLSRDERWRITSHGRRLPAKYRLTVRRCRDDGELARDLDALFRLHQKRWEQRGNPGTFASPERRQFYRDVAQRFLGRGWLELWLLEVDGQASAAQFCFRYRDTVHLLQEGFDPDYAKDRLGAFLRAEVLRAVVSEGARRYDFLAGSDPSKLRWGPQAGHYVDLHFARPLSRGGLYLGVRRRGRAAREWLRGHLPPSAFAMARGTYRALAPRTRAEQA